MKRTWNALLLAGLAAAALAVTARAPVLASDHSDAPLVGGLARQDANITDLHAFTSPRGNLVLALSTNPAIASSVPSYTFPRDVTFEILIDTDSPVDPSDPSGLFGGTIVNPGGISEDVVYRFTPGEKVVLWESRRVGSRWTTIPLPSTPAPVAAGIRRFAGLRDDPFIRRPREGRNVGALVLEVPLVRLGRIEGPLLIWATARVQEFTGPVQDHAGRSLRSMITTELNPLHPNRHMADLGEVPDVVIYDLSRPAGFPNGRRLEDDVVDLVGAPLPGEGPTFPTANDVPFLPDFPYLAPPHPAP